MPKESYYRLILTRALRITLIVLFVALALSAAILFHVHMTARRHIYGSADSVPPRRVAIIFGAAVRQKTLSDILQDRVQTGIELYHKGKVRKLLMTGDNRFRFYNEPLAMKKYAMRNGVPERDIVLDFAGRHTYDSCYRAKVIFGVDTAILVTQSYHLPRALYLAQAMGIQAIGVSAERHIYREQFYYSLREQAALLSSWFKINITKPIPILGDRLPIDLADPEPMNQTANPDGAVDSDPESSAMNGYPGRLSTGLLEEIADDYSAISRRRRHDDRVQILAYQPPAWDAH